MLLYKVPGFTHHDLYNMPVHLRSFYMKEYREWREAENATADNPEQGQEQAYQQYQNTHQNPS
tara:strand:- start:4008 stop:4196 length:189 start_codon:yes stop_codon:yes gene_type:complete